MEVQEQIDSVQKQVYRTGFGDSLNGPLHSNIRSGQPEFTLLWDGKMQVNDVKVKLYFKKASSDLYYLNKFEMELPGTQQKHTFYQNHRSLPRGENALEGRLLFTKREAYNLMQGRAVYKVMENKEKQLYNAWVTLRNGKLQIHNANHVDFDQLFASLNVVEKRSENTAKDLRQRFLKGDEVLVGHISNGVTTKIYVSLTEPQFKQFSFRDVSNLLEATHSISDLKPNSLPVKEIKNDLKQEEKSEKENKRFMFRKGFLIL